MWASSRLSGFLARDLPHSIVREPGHCGSHYHSGSPRQAPLPPLETRHLGTLSKNLNPVGRDSPAVAKKTNALSLSSTPTTAREHGCPSKKHKAAALRSCISTWRAASRRHGRRGLGTPIKQRLYAAWSSPRLQRKHNRSLAVPKRHRARLRHSDHASGRRKRHPAVTNAAFGPSWKWGGSGGGEAPPSSCITNIFGLEFRESEEVAELFTFQHYRVGAKLGV